MSANILFKDQLVALQPGETVLSGLERHGFAPPSSCRSGVCQSCMMRVEEGTLPSSAQASLKDAWKALGYFLPCVCVPAEDLSIDTCDAVATHAARIAAVETLAASVIRVLIDADDGFDFQAGQFISLVRPEDGLTRPYSIASTPRMGRLELHVAVLPDGRMSQWLASASPGEALQIRGPSGECFYQADTMEQPIVLAGTGTGLAPLLGVLRAAIEAGHRGPIHLYHGSPATSGLYLRAALEELAAEHENLRFVGSVLDDDMSADDSIKAEIRKLPIDRAVFDDLPKLGGHRIYLCGNPELVRSLKKKAYLAGASLQQIHSDPFITAGSA